MHAKVLSILFILILSISSISQLANATSAGVTSAQYQLYENTQYGFSLEYPKDWTLVEHMGSQYTAKTVLVEPNNGLQFNAGVFKNNNPYAGLTNTEILGAITTMMRNGCSNSSFQNRGFTCTGPQFTTNATSYHSVPLYEVVMVWTKTLSDGSSTKWVSMWGMIPSENDVWLMIMEGSPDEFTKYQQEIAHVANSFVIDSISQQDVSEQTNFVIPGWVKNNAKWWSEGSVTDDDFIKALQYMIQNRIIVVPSTQVISSQNHGMPSWIKNNAKWWSEGQLSDADFIKGVQYMVQNGIIVIQSGAQSALTNVLSGATFYDGESPQPEFVTYTDEDGKQVTEFAIPRQVLLLVSNDASIDAVTSMVRNNGGSILSKIPKLGIYLIQANDVPNFISSTRQSPFVEHVGPNSVKSSSQDKNSNTHYNNLQNIDFKKLEKDIDPSAKVLLVQIDNFHDKTGLCGASHGECVSQQDIPESKGISVLRLDTDRTNADIALNLKAAVLLAEQYNQKLVINLSLGDPVTDKDGKVIVSDPLKTLEKDTESYLNPVMAMNWFKKNNVVIAKSAGNGGQDLSQEMQDLGNDPKYKEAFKNIIKTGEVNQKENSPPKLTKYEDGTTSNHGDGIVYASSNDICSGGTSCATYTTATNIAYIWSLHSKDLSSNQIIDITKKSASSKDSGYPVVSLKDAYDTANKVTNCSPNCLPFGAVTNGTGTTSSGTQSQSKDNAPKTEEGSNSYGGYDTTGGTNNQDNHGNPSNGKYGGYNTPDAYCKGTYGLNYYYDASRNVCAPRLQYSNQGSNALGIDLTGQWTGTASGTIVYTDPYDSSYDMNCNFRASIALELQQNGKSLTGPISITDLSLTGKNCDEIDYSQFGGELSSTIFGSGFSGTAGPLSVSGQFTSDLMRGRYSGDIEDHTVNGDFTASRSG